MKYEQHIKCHCCILQIDGKYLSQSTSCSDSDGNEKDYREAANDEARANVHSLDYMDEDVEKDHMSMMDETERAQNLKEDLNFTFVSIKFHNNNKIFLLCLYCTVEAGKYPTLLVVTMLIPFFSNLIFALKVYLPT